MRWLGAVVLRTCDRHRWPGWWFTPALPDRRVPGILTWSEGGGAELELIGGLSPSQSSWNRITVQSDDAAEPGVISPATIWGETADGKPVSLWEISLRRSRVGAAGTFEEVWEAPWVCLGAHVPNSTTPALDSVRAGLDGLYFLTSDERICPPVWAKINGVENPGEEMADGTCLTPYVLPVVGGFRADIAAGDLDGWSYGVATWATRPWISPATEEHPDFKLAVMTSRRRDGLHLTVSVTASAKISRSDNAATSAGEALRRLQPLLGLMSLATCARPGLQSLVARSGETDVSLLVRSGHHASPDTQQDPAAVVFTLEDVPLRDFLGQWERLTQSDQAAYAWSVLTGLLGHSPALVEEHVSQTLAAAEGFHRWCLRGAKNTSLEDRLRELHAMLPKEVQRLLVLDVDNWAGWAKWARNHVDHGGAERHRELDDFYHLKVISDSVLLVTYLVALTEIGVSTDRIADALVNHGRLRILRERCAQLEELKT